MNFSVWGRWVESMPSRYLRNHVIAGIYTRQIDQLLEQENVIPGAVAGRMSSANGNSILKKVRDC